MEDFHETHASRGAQGMVSGRVITVLVVSSIGAVLTLGLARLFLMPK